MKTIRQDIEKILTALNGAIDSGQISSIEKDILLERLRKVYDDIWQLQPGCITNVNTTKGQPIASNAPLGRREIIESLYGGGGADPRKEEPPIENPEKSTASVPEDDFVVGERPVKVLNESFESGFSIDLASILASRKTSSLRSALALNDRQMLLNDLFDNDNELCDRTLDALDMLDTVDDAYIYLYENFTLDDGKEGVKLLISLLESKFA